MLSEYERAAVFQYADFNTTALLPFGKQTAWILENWA